MREDLMGLGTQVEGWGIGLSTQSPSWGKGQIGIQESTCSCCTSHLAPVLRARSCAEEAMTRETKPLERLTQGEGDSKKDVIL